MLWIVALLVYFTCVKPKKINKLFLDLVFSATLDVFQFSVINGIQTYFYFRVFVRLMTHFVTWK